MALTLGVAVIWGAAPGFPQHVHAYTDHDHPEHRHGPASHTHDGLSHHSEGREQHSRALSHHDGITPSLESCEPGLHAIRLAMVCVTDPPARVHAFEVSISNMVEPLVTGRLLNDPTDVRAHGPPARFPTPSRAPPRIPTA
jgi:hypothetical protein